MVYRAVYRDQNKEKVEMRECSLALAKVRAFVHKSDDQCIKDLYGMCETDYYRFMNVAKGLAGEQRCQAMKPLSSKEDVHEMLTKSVTSLGMSENFRGNSELKNLGKQLGCMRSSDDLGSVVKPAQESGEPGEVPPGNPGSEPPAGPPRTVTV